MGLGSASVAVRGGPVGVARHGRFQMAPEAAVMTSVDPGGIGVGPDCVGPLSLDQRTPPRTTPPSGAFFRMPVSFPLQAPCCGLPSGPVPLTTSQSGWPARAAAASSGSRG